MINGSSYYLINLTSAGSSGNSYLSEIKGPKGLAIFLYSIGKWD